MTSATTTTPRTSSPAASPAARHCALDALLETTRRQMGADLTYVAELGAAQDGSQRRLRAVVTPLPLPVRTGDAEPLAGTLCERVVRSRDAVVVPDTGADRAAASARARGIGAYVGVPLHRSDGSLYGTLCSLSSRPDAGLRERDAEVLRVIAGVVMELVEEEDAAEARRRAVLDRLAGLDATGGPGIVYQPVVDLRTSQHVGAEALSRFPAGTATPDVWFADAARVGAGAELELRAVRTALAGLPHLPGFVSVNLSPATLLDPGLARALAGAPLDRVVVEVTEHAAIDDYAGLLAALEPLRAAGLRVAVDDTGAGYASLRHVLAILPDFIKLDISLVRGLDGDRARRALAAGLVTFAESTDAAIVAEGIETAEELAVLQALGVSHGQGYHLARPAPLVVPVAG
ncbi:EAL domain-containing protein [Paenibacillus sp. TRM 82003]|uniref:sensor domain-containing phosphodiesterase n=1 Tax=Kineococcus sp. TRM81007 TaxID=2925831 RepID=UPI001F5AC6E4|nr:EAL domain-containing protein [Kineococcus sp. TRM81007]MCI2240626.1 EAL domain-containing protein [Kineococcus sp. TRM81007]MCI3925452.1 EAL domain-containing protein [Paenibacillus sp. TRM 82003]